MRREAAISMNVDAKRAERDALVSWREALELEGACPEAKMLVQAQLDRVLQELSRIDARGERGSAVTHVRTRLRPGVAGACRPKSAKDRKCES